MTSTLMSTGAAARAPATGINVRAAWRRRVSRIGSLIQLAFAALWLGRGMLATGWPGRSVAAIALITAVVALGVWWGIRTRGATPRPAGAEARRLERKITVATVLQLAASFALPFAAVAVGRPDLIVATVAVTIGLLLLWLRAVLRTPGHLVAGALLVFLPLVLGLSIAGDPLTASVGLATGAILVGSAAVGIRSLNPHLPSPAL